MQELGFTLDQRKFTSYLHNCIQEVHGSGLIRYQNSCLIEVLESAVQQYANVGACNAQIFDGSFGGKFIYIKVPRDAETTTKLDEITNLLTHISSANYDQFGRSIEAAKKAQTIDKIRSAVQEAMKEVTTPNMAKL